jgi:hypothetical protein
LAKKCLSPVNFSGNDVGIAGNFLNGKKNTFTLPLIAEIDKSGQFDSFGVKFDYGIDFTVGLEGFLDVGSIGRTDFDYPINANITLPDDIQPNKKFSIDTSFNVDNASKLLTLKYFPMELSLFTSTKI